MIEAEGLTIPSTAPPSTPEKKGKKKKKRLYRLLDLDLDLKLELESLKQDSVLPLYHFKF